MGPRIHSIRGQLVIRLAVAKGRLIEIDRHNKVSCIPGEAGSDAGGGMRRSRVAGNIGFTSAFGSATGVRASINWKRSRRRFIASAESEGRSL